MSQCTSQITDATNLVYLQQKVREKADDIVVKDREYKVVMLGEASVGKTSLVQRYVNNTFNEASDSTIGASYRSKRVETDCGIIKLCLWDTAGQERYSGLMPMYYRGSNVAYVVFDLSREASFERAKKWIADVKNTETSYISGGEVIIALIGNKTDLPTDQTSANHKLAIKYAKEQNIIYATTSAKSADGVKEAFAMPILFLMERDSAIPEPVQDESIIELEDKKPHIMLCSGCTPGFITRRRAEPLFLTLESDD